MVTSTFMLCQRRKRPTVNSPLKENNRACLRLTWPTYQLYISLIYRLLKVLLTYFWKLLKTLLITLLPCFKVGFSPPWLKVSGLRSRSLILNRPSGSRMTSLTWFYRVSFCSFGLTLLSFSLTYALDDWLSRSWTRCKDFHERQLKDYPTGIVIQEMCSHSLNGHPVL